ncbi:hypothetical protein Dsin_020217 [Dipteronia sinensis]|uniref:FAE domain-containing protein n=1 Tax=Dipteronia sinensis TaxID=43782 RepID=A0AAE0E3S9_9ROSI|nr:hypothetical protein Dsin_020217 [Dipteronia sinensis]
MVTETNIWYECCIQREDEQGRQGFHLAKNLPKAVTPAFVDNLREISPKNLLIRELHRAAEIASGFDMVNWFRFRYPAASPPPGYFAIPNFRTDQEKQ